MHCDAYDVPVSDFSHSFADGRAFCAIMAGVCPGRVHYDQLDLTDRRLLFETAFQVRLGVCEGAGIESLASAPFSKFGRGRVVFFDKLLACSWVKQ